MSKGFKRTGLVLLLLMAFLLESVPVLANAGPPPRRTWFTFVGTDAAPLRPQAVQFLACETPSCDAPLAVYEYGTCSAAGCLDASPLVISGESLECTADRCVLTVYDVPDDAGYFKVLAQYPDMLRSSESVIWNPGGYGDVRAWTVRSGAVDLALQEDASFVEPMFEAPNLLHSLALTLVVEMLVAGVGLWLWDRAAVDKLAGRILMVGLLNMLSYPLVWVVFPAFAQFQYRPARTFGFFVLPAVVLYAAALVWIYVPARPKLGWKIGLTVLSLPLVAIVLLLVYIVIFYGNPPLAVPGLPAPVLLLLTEAFVTLFEAAMLFMLSRKTLSVTQSVVISLLMNLASFLAGLLVF